MVLNRHLSILTALSTMIQRKMRIPLPFKFVILVLAMLCAAPVLAKSVEIETKHRGIRLVGISLPLTERQDIEIMALAPAMAKIKKAIERIYKGTKFSAERIETLKKNGRVTLVYDAGFPENRMASVIIAAFFPDFFQIEKGGLKEFLVVIGRFGIKWPTDKLAAVIVHELVGHGLQHLRGRTEKDRKIDKECEALIYEEKAYQDLKVRRDTRDMQKLRRDIRDKWCSDFRAHLTRKGLNADKVWNYGRPDVSKLLVYFNAYIDHLRKTGVAGKAVAAAKSKREDNVAEAERRVEATGSASDMLRIGNRYLKGIGVNRDPRKGVDWIRKSAEHGHAQAQHVLGILYNAGFGLKKNAVEAYKWMSLASKRGIKKAKLARRKLKARLNTQQLRAADKWIAQWRPKRRG
ncbi:MAG: hypothetical protein CL397_15245 [Acidiferrobacteraceae bacterium]|nr:hypothetical protein [Acidiferrobacteraceae bacterium]